jgi:hypothetical protein
MDKEIMGMLKKLEATNAAMDQLAKKVKRQCEVHMREIEKCMTAHSLFVERRFTSKPTANL